MRWACDVSVSYIKASGKTRKTPETLVNANLRNAGFLHNCNRVNKPAFVFANSTRLPSVMWIQSQRLSELHQICLRPVNKRCWNANFLCACFPKLNAHSRWVENKPPKADFYTRWSESDIITVVWIKVTKEVANSAQIHTFIHTDSMLNSPLLPLTSATFSGSLLLAAERKTRARLSWENPNLGFNVLEH